MGIDRSKFACKCCGENKIGDKIVKICSDIQLRVSNLEILSGYRCLKNDKAQYTGKLEKWKKSSKQHTKGTAADIKCSIDNQNILFSVCGMLYENGTIKGLGKYSTFRHIDVRTSSKVTW